MKKQSFAKGTIIGAVFGTIAGLLFAPKSGKETQKMIKNKVKGTYQEMHNKLEDLSDELAGRVDNLKVAAGELKGEAKEESQDLIRKAEILKQDMRIAASDMAKSGTNTKDTAMKHVKQLIGEGSDVMSELERVTKQLASSAKDKVKSDKTDSEA